MKIDRVKFEEFPGGIVKASVSNCRYDALDKINSKFIATATSALNLDCHTWSKAGKNYLMNNTYVAIARCAPDDEYDFEMGKKIAMKKLNDKYHHSMDRRISRFENDMNKVMESLSQYFQYRG